MRLLTKLRLSAFVALVGASLSFPAAAPARVHHVGPGESIQREIDRASPGDAIVVAAGVYHENLTILAKDHITLRGAGATPGGTVLEPAATPHPSICTEFGEVNGICVTGAVDPVTRANGAPITGARVSGFLVRHFTRFGILVNNAIDTTISDSEASHSGGWGMAGFIVSGVRYLRDVSHDNGQGGLYIADSPEANAAVIGNRAFRNAREEGLGLLVRDASHGVVRDNELRANCAGIWFLDGPLAGATGDWAARENVVHDNSAACPPSEDIPVPISGFGIALTGTDHVVAHDNIVTGNQPSGDTVFAGGIVVASTTAFGGADPTNNLVDHNTALHNVPADLVYDGSGSANRFVANDCGTSIPDGLCENGDAGGGGRPASVRRSHAACPPHPGRSTARDRRKPAESLAEPSDRCPDRPHDHITRFRRDGPEPQENP